MELEESMPFLEWLANNYKNFGATLEIITGMYSRGKNIHTLGPLGILQGSQIVTSI